MRQIEADVSDTTRKAHWLHRWQVVLVWLGILGAVAGGVLKALPLAQEWSVAAWAVAASAWLSAYAFRPQRRYRAHLRHLRCCEDLLRRLRLDGARASDISREWIASNTRRDHEWPDATVLPAQGSGHLPP
jgi:hypothetical protein